MTCVGRDLPFAEGGKSRNPRAATCNRSRFPKPGPHPRRLFQNVPPPPPAAGKASSFPPTPQRFFAQSRGTSVAHLHAVRGKAKMSREDARMMRSRREMDEGRERAAHGT